MAVAAQYRKFLHLDKPQRSNQDAVLAAKEALLERERQNPILGLLFGDEVPMQPAARLGVPRFSMMALLLIGLAGVPALGQDAIAQGEQSPLPFGKVTVLGPVTCPSGKTEGASCTSVSVTCPEVPDLTATVSEAFPVGTSKGTIILANGGGGTTFFNAWICQHLPQ